MNSDINRLEEYIPGIDSDLKDKFVSFYNFLAQYNLKLNLVSRGSLMKAAAKHFCDCYVGLVISEPHFNLEKPIFDFGSGNGFPGIIAGLMFSTTKVLLVERDVRKAEFLKAAASHLEMDNIEVHGGSVSDLTDGSVQQCISRAMAPLPKFLLETRNVTQSGGVSMLFKGTHWSSEFGNLPPQLFDYWDVEPIQEYTLPADEGRRVIIKCIRV